MPVFNYSGRNARGELMRGHLESQNTQAVAAWMLAAGITPITIKAPTEVAQPEWLRKLNERALTDVDLLLFTRQMGAMMKAGVAALQALAAIQKSTLKPRLVRLLQEMSDDLDNGLELSGAIAHHPKFFNDYYVSMVRVGEGSGRLEEVFRRLFDQLEFQKQMKQKIKGAVRYPMFVMTAIGIGIAILNYYVIPSFAKVYGALNADLPLLTRVLVGTSNFTVNYWWAVIAALFLAVFAFRSWAATRDGRYILDKYKLRIPIIGSIIRKVAVARFSRILSTLLSSGVPILQSLDITAKTAGNVIVEDAILKVRAGVERGENFVDPLKATNVFPHMVGQMIGVGEQTGALDAMLGKIADFYEEEVDTAIADLLGLMEPVLIAFLGVTIGSIVISMYLPLFSLIGKLAGGPK